MSLKKERGSILLDYYGDLLSTNHQREILDDYFNEDLSMIEIAENLQISKSAVSDLIKRSIQQLEDFDKRLKLIRQDEAISSLVEEMCSSNNDEIIKYAKKLKKIIRG